MENRPPTDRPAAQFTRATLMPRQTLTVAVRARHGSTPVDLADDAQVRPLAEQFRTSVALMAVRLWEEGLGKG